MVEKGLVQTSVGVGEQSLLAELLRRPEEASAEVRRRRGVPGEEGGQTQQAARVPETLEVLGILSQPGAEHGAHRPAATPRRHSGRGAYRLNTIKILR